MSAPLLAGIAAAHGFAALDQVLAGNWKMALMLAGFTVADVGIMLMTGGKL